MSSYMRLNDGVSLNKINPYADPMNFTPGVPLGGAYKTIYAPSSEPQVALVNAVRPTGDALGGPLDTQMAEPSPGCEKTIAAGWRTPYYCTPGSQDYPLNREPVPERNYSLPPWNNVPKANNDSILMKTEGMMGIANAASMAGGTAALIILAISAITVFKVL
jgi:hypothetical protein